jgi:glycosyltransferase involved in cell wall biosynthesis
MSASEPHVSVVMPVYDGEQFIADAIKSVQAQTFQNIDIAVVNNCSKDRTREIVARLAESDSRIRIHDNEVFLNVIDNHSKAFSLVSPHAKYVKCLDADDWLFATCIEELVRVAEAHPTVGMVTSYVLAGTRVAFDGLPYPSTFTPGRELCRMRLLHGVKVFGGSSASLIRADVARKNQPFYNPLNYHGDNDAYLTLLRDHDFGYVHQVLSYNRRDEASRTTAYIGRVHGYEVADLQEITTHGRAYLTDEEFKRRLREAASAYHRFLGASILRLPSREFWHYHFVHVKRLGIRISYTRVGLYSLARIVDVLLNPKRTIEGALRRLWKFLRPQSRGE